MATIGDLKTFFCCEETFLMIAVSGGQNAQPPHPLPARTRVVGVQGLHGQAPVDSSNPTSDGIRIVLVADPA